MCGICGIFEHGRSGYPNLEPIGRMTDALSHRGPDSDGTWTAGRLALGHRRLSIFDLSSAGAQPMASADGRAMVVFNGEIYNFREIREGLESAGFRFRSGSDTEVLLAQYRHRGIEGIHEFRGMFAFALWDLDREELYVVRDRLGIKPLYYVDRDGLLVFASEIKSLLRHPEVGAVLDAERLGEWLALRYNSAPHTLFRDIHKLEPGCYLRVDRSGVHRVRYWDVDLRQERIGRHEAVERYAELFRESVRLRMRADVPVGVFLSGGLDSSMVALEAAAATSRPIQTFTVGYRDNGHLSELERARLVAEHLGSEHHELILDEVDPDALGEVVWHLEEPVGDPATVLLHRLSEFTRRNVTVVLSGEGSDETNLGYGRTKAFRRWSSLREQALVGSLLGRLWLRRNGPTALDRGWERVDEGRIYAELTWGGAARRAALAGDHGDRWLRGLQGTLDPLDPGADRLSRLLYLDLKGWLADDLLLKVDKTTMAYALEARVPFLDHKLVEFNLRLPPSWKIGASGTKLLAREVVRGRLPDSTVARSQHGFIAPLASWFSQGWRGMLERSLGPDGLAARRLFAPALLDTVRRDIREGRSESLMLGFMLMSLEHWFERFDVQVEPLEVVRA